MTDAPLLGRDDILNAPIGRVTVALDAELNLSLRELTVADADHLAEVEREFSDAREIVVRVLHHQLETPSLTTKEISAWDDVRLVSAFRAWAADAGTLDRTLPEDAGVEEAGQAVSSFVRERTEGADRLVNSPVVAVVAAAQRDWDRHVDPLGLRATAQRIQDLELATGHVRNLAGLKAAMEAIRAAELAKLRLADWTPPVPVPASLLHQMSLAVARPSTVLSGVAWSDQLSTLKATARALAGVQSVVTQSMMRTTLLAESAMVGIDLSTLSRRWSIPQQTVNGFSEAVRGHFQAYEALVGARGGAVPEVDPRLVYELPAVEVFNESEMARVLAGAPEEDEGATERQERTGEIAEDLRSELPDLLRQIDPRLLRLWTAAHQSQQGDNVDRARHVLASLRTLFDEVLDLLAPQKVVKAWCGPDDLLEDGRVKREARFRYVARHLEFKRFVTAFEADMVALVKTYGILNALHEMELAMSDRELALVIIRIEGALRQVILTANAAPTA